MKRGESGARLTFYMCGWANAARLSFGACLVACAAESEQTPDTKAIGDAAAAGSVQTADAAVQTDASRGGGVRTDASRGGGVQVDATTAGPSADSAPPDNTAPSPDSGAESAPLPTSSTGTPPPPMPSPEAGVASPPPISVTTNRYDNLRSGANLTESTLDTSTVGGSRFGLLYSDRVDGQVYAQPLYLAGVKLGDGTTRDLLFVATEHNTVFAFDAKAKSAAAPVWTKSLGPSGSTLTGKIACDNLTPEVGITATPVIDPATGTLYVVSKNYNGTSWSQSLHALGVTDGKELPGSPKVITASVTNKAGAVVSFDPMLHLGRPGLLLEGGIVYMAFASHCDIQPYHGWVLGYEYGSAGFTQTHVFNVSPNGSEGGIWQAGVGLSSDGTSLYITAGNGSTNPTSTPPDLSEGVIRLSLADFSVADYWIPTAYASLNSSDADLSTGAILLPHNLLVTGSKGGTLYLLDRSNLGKYSPSGDGILQSITTQGKLAGLLGHLHGGPVYYADPSGPEWLFAWPEDSQLSGYRMDPKTHLLQTSGGAPTVSGNFAAQVPGHPGGILTLSGQAGVAGSAVLWATTPLSPNAGAWHKTDTGMFYAVDASDITRVLWKSTPLQLDDGTTANFGKFNPPVVANGRVYLATFSNAVNVYGLR